MSRVRTAEVGVRRELTLKVRGPSVLQEPGRCFGRKADLVLTQNNTEDTLGTDTKHSSSSGLETKIHRFL